jgi:hypothetical protein
MVDIKKVKEALLKEFGGKAPPPEQVAKDETIDAVLHQYFNKLSHMPREITLDAITNSLRLGKHEEKGEARKRVKRILDRFLP